MQWQVWGSLKGSDVEVSAFMESATHCKRCSVFQYLFRNLVHGR